MSLTYTQFKDFVLTSLWRPNDTELLANLDILIGHATNELRARTADWQKRRQSVVIAPTSGDFDLSANVSGFESVVSLTDNAERGYYEGKRSKTFYQVPLAQVYADRANYPGQTLSVYAVENTAGQSTLRFASDYTTESPGDLTLVYMGGVPDYESTDSSWLQSEHGGLYLNTVLKHCAMFVREDDRAGLYSQLADAAFLYADQEDKHHKSLGGSPLKMQPHHKVP
jgi:hypothetical protein